MDFFGKTTRKENIIIGLLQVYLMNSFEAGLLEISGGVSSTMVGGRHKGGPATAVAGALSWVAGGTRLFY